MARFAVLDFCLISTPQVVTMSSNPPFLKLLGAGHSSEMQVIVTFKDGRSCVISGPAKGVSPRS